MKNRTTVKELFDSGLIFEINRKVLHPLGLAIAIRGEENTDGKMEWTFSNEVWDYRDDPEGINFEVDLFDKGMEKLLTYMDEKGDESHKNRKESLGYVVQKEGDDRGL